ncbi:MAG: ABC transporter ATP-binding protein [Firmicutes bacterium]|nr:ABC transporter ATP-binding protein [Bacillota bacterium]
MLKIQGLYAGYAGTSVLNDVSLNVRSGEVTVIVGPNGCGKSTLLKAITGILKPTDGEILVGDAAAAGLCPVDEMTAQERAQKISYLAQSKQVPDITALRMVLHGRFPYLGFPRRYRSTDFDIARTALERMGIGDLEDSLMSMLSGGTRQKVYIAMALAQDTPIILMDEPTTFLDISYQLQMMEQARMLADEGKAVVMVLHDLPLALEHADQLVVMDHGTVVAAGCPETVYHGGYLNEVFGVNVKRVETVDGWKYYSNMTK